MLFTLGQNSYYFMKIGVFALQGAFIEHEHALQKLGAEVVEIRRLAHFSEHFDGLVLPGGESTVQGKLLREEGLFAPLKAAIEGGMPVLATCAGLILLANKIEGGEAPHLQTLNVTVRRNAYGRQLGSFTANTEVKGIGEYPAVFPPSSSARPMWRRRARASTSSPSSGARRSPCGRGTCWRSPSIPN